MPIFIGFPADETNELWERINNFKPFSDYCANMDPRFCVERITIQAIDMFRDRIGFMKLVASIKDEEGGFVPGSAFLRGGSVVMLLILRDVESKVDYTIITRQARSPVGRYDLYELPAGTLDGSQNFAGKAADEINEELGIVIDPAELIDMTTLAYGENCPGVYASPGGSDEAFRIFLCVQKMSHEKIISLHGRLTGLRDKGEKIRTEIIPVHGAWRIPDAKTLAALMLYEKYLNGSIGQKEE